MSPHEPSAELSRQLGADLERRAPPVGALRRAGSEDPERDAEAFVELTAHPDLGPQAARWAPALLRSARPGAGARSLLELGLRRRDAGLTPLDLARCRALPLVLGSSDFLARLLLRRPEFCDALVGDPPPPPAATPIAPDWREIRLEKYRALLRIAARDLLDRPFEESLRELSEVADRALVAALEVTRPDARIEAPATFALGKLGGLELNFSSDVDLLFVYGDVDANKAAEHHTAIERWVRTLKRGLEEPSEDGFGYRVDLDLRPLGVVGPLAHSVDAALRYYETRGAEWERQMLIRLRGVAGPLSVRQEFSSAIAPFSYRQAIDSTAIDGVRQMKLRIETERREAGRDLELDLKEGPGGIRDVEFFAQALQLFHGGRELGLRHGNTLDALRVLADRELLPSEVAESLRASYLWLRRAEHALQLAEERQVHRVPAERAAQLALARRMGYAQAEGREAHTAFLEDWFRVRAAVRQHFDALVLEGRDD